MTKPTDLVQGTLDLLIMRTIASEKLHGWAIAQRIQLLSKDVLQVNQGSLYPALQRLERQGWITADWGVSENNRRARFYRLTAPGKRRLDQERADRDRLSAPISLVIRNAYRFRMRFIYRLIAMARALFRSGAVDTDIADELQFHVEREAEANIRRGMTPDDAYRAA